jgi:hypothetical protein
MNGGFVAQTRGAQPLVTDLLDHASQSNVGSKAVGRWLIWTLDGKLFLEAVFTQPYDYFANERLSGRRWGPR